jgi:hypothetical protein
MITALVLATLAVAQAERPPSPAPSPSPSPAADPFSWQRPLPAASPRPVSDSIDRVVERMEAERDDPCLLARSQNVPCFPARTDLNGPTASVREGLGIIGPMTKPTPGGAPTRDEMGPHRPMPGQSAVSVGFDPGCVGKSILKGLRGKNDTYYLYRLRDANGVRAALYDHRIDPANFQGEVELVAELRGECAAVNAYEAERRRLQPAPR